MINPNIKTEQEYILLAQQGNVKALEILFKNNYDKIYNIAKKYSSLYFLDIEDLIQDGYLGLLEAINKYTIEDYFSTQSMVYIKSSSVNSINNNYTKIRVPFHILYQIKTNINDQQLDEISYINNLRLCKNRLDISNEEKELYINMINQSNYIPITDIKTQFIYNSTFDYSEMKLDIQSILNLANLSDREYDIILNRFGFIDDTPKTLEEIGKIYNVSRERIRQLEYRALRKISKIVHTVQYQ